MNWGGGKPFESNFRINTKTLKRNFAYHLHSQRDDLGVQAALGRLVGVLITVGLKRKARSVLFYGITVS
jgi:hypothetical protein